jgi:hypothetical protein
MKLCSCWIGAIRVLSASHGAEAAAERLAGGRPSRAQSLLAATAAGVIAAVTTYGSLRSGGQSSSD